MLWPRQLALMSRKDSRKDVVPDHSLKDRASAKKVAANPTKLGIDTFEKVASIKKKMSKALQADVEEISEMLGRMRAADDKSCEL